MRVKLALIAFGLLFLLVLELSYSITIRSYAIEGETHDILCGPVSTTLKELARLARFR